MKSIILVGYMCVGKTTIGKELARRLGLTFYDLDWYIEERFRQRVSQIFETHGESYFRDLEHRMLHEVAEFENVVLACGGGTPCFFDNMDYMNRVGYTFYLKASPCVILHHLAMSKGKRPLLMGKKTDELRAFITTQLSQRAPFYEKAQHTCNVDVLKSKDRVDVVIDEIKANLNINRTNEEVEN